MSAYQELQALAERARTGAFRVPLPPRWSVADGDVLARPAAVLLLFGSLHDVPPAPARLATPAGVPGSPGAPAPARLLAPSDLDILLVERAATLSDHPGQVAFPGGGVDAGDGSIADAALREAEEETGLDPSGVEILGMLPRIPVPVSNYIVTPVLGWWARQTPVDVVDYGESAQVFRVPVRDLLDPGNRVTATLRRGGQRYRGPAFSVNGTLVWGFTAGILTQVFVELGWAVPWDESREVPAPV